jgi:antirestriction protein ArdC
MENQANTIARSYKKTVLELYTTAVERAIAVNVSTQQMSITGREFKGLNNSILALSKAENGFESDMWLTEKQMETMGLTVKNDEEPTIVFTTFLKDVDSKKEFGIRYYKVFNKMQTKNMEIK